MIGFPQLRRTTLKRKQFTDEQIVAALRDVEATTNAEAARKHGVSEPSIHRWKKQYADMEVSDVRELKRLKDENGRLKKLLAERDLEVEVMKELQAKKW
jgi:putative transposase